MNAAPAQQKPADPRARLLFDLAETLGPRYGCERSFAVRPGGLSTQRFLLTLSAATIGNLDTALTETGRRMQMPAAYRELARQHLDTTAFVHLGFEQAAGAGFYKLYLEQRTPAAPPAGEPILLHLGFKWDPADPARHVLTRYTWYPALDLGEILRRTDAIYGDRNVPRSIAHDLLQTAAGSIAEEDIRYLDVSEEGNPRHSFDVNVYDAGLSIENLTPFLGRMWRHYWIAPEQAQPLVDAIRSSRFGHLAGGIHRDGRDFFNVYYGVESRHG